MFVLACFVLNFLKNCVVHSSYSLSYLLCASFGPAGLILAASSLICVFSFRIFVILAIDGGFSLFCIFLSEFSSSPSLMFSVDFSFAFLCFFVSSIKYTYACSLNVSHMNFPVSLSQFLRSFFNFGAIK